MQQKIFNLLLEQEEVSWKTIIQDLVKTEQMDPWDINITLLTKKYIKIIKEMQEHDLRISGKILLAAAILLKMKSAHLLDNDISQFDALLAQPDESFDEDFFDEFMDGDLSKAKKEKYPLIHRHPQPRSRKVSINDLVDALQRAMESKRKILEKIRPVRFQKPAKVDVMEVIREIYHKIVYYTKKEKTNKLTFTKLLPPQAGKEEKVHTFIPLLHLENQQKVAMAQRKHFEEIWVKLLGKGG